MRTQLYLTPADHGRRLSLEEFEHAASQEGYWYELIGGKLEVSPVPNMPHDTLRKWMEGLLNSYAATRPEVINEVRGPARVFLPEADEVTAPEPDLAAYHDFPRDLPIEEGNWQDVSPVLVIEIISADTADKDLVRNRRLYLQVPSIREYWILDPRASHDRPSLIVYRRGGRRWRRPIAVPYAGTYTTDLLPGFSLVVDPHA